MITLGLFSYDNEPGPELSGLAITTRGHTGSGATEAINEMGADAYATGNHVVLGNEADLFTVAHEAAHVVQQRSGVHLKGGVGEDGDPYERTPTRSRR